ncbi:10797_t:CDS:10 [Diversispora eburnea]|uniref:Structural maintenance of chromosomes protein 5 n=1 Tax=Diversispora eburnea TaxID=1213867 RepID=A0A9N8W5R2_9GLOM|nr:10797_t:CDS:10 [Diversispora eburnea]
MAQNKTRILETEVSEEQSFSRASTPSESCNKRMRIDDNSCPTPSSPWNTSRKGKSSQEDRYQMGSIVRVCLKNFVTYDSVEFYPGPNLNMIIGPNGTGKSTIVCAIALGLGWNTSLLGRAKEISDFVKHGQERQNVTHREIQARVASINIQVDNLCQFLPQDKVCEFSQMSPPELLTQTQKAVGEKEMIEWHERLIELRNEEKSISTAAKADGDQIDNLEKRNAILERDVTRFREREAIMKRVRLYELRIPFARYGIAKNLYDELKEVRNEAHNEYNRLSKENEPANARKSELENNVKELTQEKKQCSDSFVKKRREMEGVAGKLEKTEGEIDTIRKDLSSIKRKEKMRRTRIAQLREEISDIEAKLQIPPSKPDSPDLIRRFDDVNNRMREITSKIGNNRELQSQIDGENKILYRDMASFKRQLQNLEDVRRRRLDALRNEPATIAAIEWLDQNRDRLNSRVYGPVCLEVNIKNMHYADAVEALLGHFMKTFVCEVEQDYHIVTKALCDEKGLKINVVCFSHLSMAKFQPPMSNNQLRTHGFESYLLDQIDAPPTLCTAICNEAQFHRIPVARNESDVDHKNVEKLFEFRKYIAGDTSYSITASKYGRRLKQSYTTRIRPARIFTNTINVESKRILESQLNEIQIKLKENEQSLYRLKREEQQLNGSLLVLNEEKAQISEEKNKARAALNEYEKLKIRLESKNSQLGREINRPQSVQYEENVLKEKLCEIARKRGQLAEEFQNFLDESMQLFSGRVRASLLHLQAVSELHALERQTQDRDDALKQAHARFTDANKKFLAAKSEAKRLLNAANSENEEIDEETREALQELNGMSLEELEDGLASDRAKANLHYTVDPNVIQTYDNRKAQIDDLKSKLLVKTNRLEVLMKEMATLRENWEPQLNELVKQISKEFSNAFDRIGCVGEVRISTNDDYDKWGIDILVKFRDNEKLQVLTGQRQSGGERSVSTIMYLMALQELAKTPFRVVDEINQGMDPRNERLVHSQMIQTACRPNTAQ